MNKCIEKGADVRRPMAVLLWLPVLFSQAQPDAWTLQIFSAAFRQVQGTKLHSVSRSLKDNQSC